MTAPTTDPDASARPRPRPPLATVGLAVGVVLAALVLGRLLAVAVPRLGAAAVVLPLAALGAWYLLRRPGVALGVLVGTTIGFEESPDALFDLSTDAWYSYVGPVQPVDLVFVVFVASVALAGFWDAGPAGRSRLRLCPMGPFTLPLVLLAVATAMGLVTGWYGDNRFDDLAISAKTLGYLIVLPVLAAPVLLDPAQRRRAIAVVGLLVVAKDAYAVAAYAVGRALDDGVGGQLTYYEAPVNHLSMLYLLAVAAALFARQKLPRWALIGTPVVALCFALSLRRSFWIAFVLALVLLVIVATGRRGRPWLVLGSLALGVAVWAVVLAGGSTDTSNPVVERAQTINPTDLRSNSTDRYRLEEQRNVIEEIQRRPLTGLGLGVPWVARHPLSEEHVGGRFYTHTVALWYWLKLGPLGLAAYLWLTGAMVWAGHALWRRSRWRPDRVVGLALAAGTVGLAVAELTGSFTGVSLRFTVVTGAIVGWLAAALADLPDHQVERYPGGRSERAGGADGTPPATTVGEVAVAPGTGWDGVGGGADDETSRPSGGGP